MGETHVPQTTLIICMQQLVHAANLKCPRVKIQGYNSHVVTLEILDGYECEGSLQPPSGIKSFIHIRQKCAGSKLVMFLFNLTATGQL
jgi:hypothetical protein